MKDQIIHISFANINFKCPYCNKQYKDKDDKYLDKCNKNKNGYTIIKCECKHTFGMTYNYKGEAVGFKLDK
jgi:hypothetical protein